MSKKKNRRIKKAFFRFATVIIILSITIGGIVGTKYGRRLLYKVAAHYIHNNIENETQDESPEVEVTREDIFDDNEPVLNYLIFGVEEIAGDCNTDSMLIASVNWKEGDIKITSLMRDTYVEIPGFKKNKLNAAFARGGIDIFMQTIKANYKIPINGYAYVNFESFQNVIDLLGGVSIELTKDEAYYLNTKNYISEQKNRCVSEGMNILNGNQVLGYCRIRHVRTITNNHDDYGRTERQRRVLSAIFDKCKKKIYLI